MKTQTSRQFLARLASRRFFRRSRTLGFALGATAVLAASPGILRAGNTWTGGGSTPFNWSDNNNWGGAQPTFGTYTFAGSFGTTNTVDQSYTTNQLLWTGTSAWTTNSSNSATISLFDNGGTQSKIENQSTGLVTLNVPITFAATTGAAWGEINAVNGNITFGTGTLTVNGSQVAGIRMFGSGKTTTFNNTVSASGKYFATTGTTAATVAVGGAFTSGDLYIMNGSTLNLNSGGTITTSALRLGGDFGTTGAQNQALGATLALTNTAGGQSFGSIINSVASNTSGALLIDSQNTSNTNTISGNIFLDSNLRVNQASGGSLAITNSTLDVKAQTLTLTGGTTGNIGITGVIGNSTGSGQLVVGVNGTVGGPIVTLSNANTYSGDTFVRAGNLAFTSTGSANNSTIRLGSTSGTSVNANLTLTTLAGGTTIGSVINPVATTGTGTTTIDSQNTSGTNTLSNQIALDRALTITESGVIGTGTLAITQSRSGVSTTTGTDIKANLLTLNVTNLGNTINYSGDIYNSTGAGSVTKTGFGLLTFSGTNTYTGATTVSAGILRLAGGAAIADAGIVSTAAGGLLDLNGTSETIGSLSASAGSINLGSGALTLADNNASSVTGLVYGTGGSLVKQGANTLTLGTLQGSSNSFSSGNLFSGGITLSAGTLTISTANASGSGLITAASTLNISSSQLLLTGGITINGGTTTLSQTNAAGLGTVTLNTGGTLTVTNNAAAQLASVVLNAGTLTTPAQAIIFGSLAGTQGFTQGAFALTLGTNNTSGTYSGVIAGAVASNLTKTGSGTQTLNGTDATTGTITANGSGGTLAIGGQFNGNGAVAVQSGTLQLNFGTNNAVASNLVNPAALTLAGGTLSAVGQTGATNAIQNFTGSTFTAGTASTVSAINGAGGGTTAVNLAGLTRNAGSAVNFVLPSGVQSTTNGIQASSGGAGLLVPTNNTAYATVGGTSFAAKDATSAFIVPLTGSVTATGGTSLTATATDNADINSATVSTSGASTINTVRFNNVAGSTATLGGTLTVTDGGILVSSAVTSAGSKITGGSITAGSGGSAASTAEVVIHQFSAQPFTLNSPVVNSTVTNAAGIILTKTGPGMLILTASNSNSGFTYVDSGTLQIGAGGNVGSNSVLSLAPNDPTAVFDLNNQTTIVGNISGGSNTGGYVNFGSTGTLNDVSNFSSTYSGALVGGVNSVFNKTGGSQGIQGSNQAFYGTLNIATGSTIGNFGGGGFINATVNLTGTAAMNQGGGGTTTALGNLAGTGGTLTSGSNTGAGGTYNIGYLGGTSSFAGVIGNGTFAGTPGLTNLGKFGSGTTTLSGANTYTGTTTIYSGGLTFDYATNVPLPTGSALTIGGGTATFLGKAAGTTAISTGTFGVSSSVLSNVIVNANNVTPNAGTGTTLTLKTAVINGVNTLGSTTTSNVLLFDTSSSASNVLLTDLTVGPADGTIGVASAIRTQNGLLTTGANPSGTGVVVNTNGYRADVLIRDSTGIGFATNNGTTTISRYLTASATTVPSGSTAMSDMTNYKVSNSSVTRTAAVLYNTLELDSSTSAASLTANFDTFTRFGNGGASVSGRGVLATGSNGATITSGGGTNQPTYFYNYQTGTTAGQTLTLNMPLSGTSYFNGTGLTVATGTVNNSDSYFQSGVTRLTGAQSSGDALAANSTGGVYRLVGGILEIGADLTGSASPTSTADFSRSVGASAGQVQLLGDTGFSAFGGNRTVNLGGAGQQLLWGNDNFLASPAAGTTEGNNTFRLSSAYSDSMVDFQNAIALGNITRNVDVANGSAAVDARLSGVISGVFALTVTLANGNPAVLNAAAGLNKLGLGTLELTGANTYKGQTTVSAGTLLVNNTTGSGTGTGPVVVNNNGTLLGGTGTISGTVSVGTSGAAITAATRGTTGTVVASNVGILNTGALTLTAGSVFHFDVLNTGGTAGTSYDQVAVTGTVALGNATLEGSILSGLNFTAGQTLTLIDNDGTDAFTGTFNGIAQGSTVFLDSYAFTASYTGGTGNDFVLTAVPEPATWLGGGLLVVGAAWSQRKRFRARQAA